MAGVAPRVEAQIPLPKLEARVTDLTGTLTAAQQSALEEKLAAFEERKGAQIAVLILPTTEPEDIAQFGVRLMEAWKLGRKGVDDGAVLIVAKEDRELRIEVQYGLEGALTDATSGRIINDTIVPLFKQGDFYGGINAGVDQMLRVVDGEPLPEPDQAWKARRRATCPGRCIAVRRADAAAAVLRPLRPRAGGAASSASLAAASRWWVTLALVIALGAFVGVFLLALLIGIGGRRPLRGRAGVS